MTDKACVNAGDKEAAQELAGKGKEHAQLAKEARTKANQAAYDSSNLSVANRFKVTTALPAVACAACNSSNLGIANGFKVSSLLLAIACADADSDNRSVANCCKVLLPCMLLHVLPVTAAT